MKPRALVRLIVSLLVILGFVVVATMLESNGSLNTTAWYWAQRKLPLLWVVDGFAALTLLPVLGFAVLQNRLARKSEESAHSRDERQNQMETMIHDAEQTERRNSEQAERIAALQETVDSLSAKLTEVQTEALARQNALEAETHRLAEQAFAALVGQVEANTRQMEAVSLAMQYQRAEIKQLRQGMRAIGHAYDIIDVAHLLPAELTALRGEDVPRLLEDSEEEKRRREEEEKAEEEDGRRKTEDESSTLNAQRSTLNSVGFFEPTMNAETTFIAPMMEYEITPFVEDRAVRTEVTDVPSETSETGVPADFPPEAALSEMPLSRVETTSPAPVAPTSDSAVTVEDGGLLGDQTADSAPEATALLADETEQPPQRKSGLRRWLSRS